MPDGNEIYWIFVHSKGLHNLKMNNQRKQTEEFDIERMKQFAALSLRKKLEYLEERLLFLNRFMSNKAKRISRKLKEEGF